MKVNTRMIAAREALVVFWLLASWFVTLILLATFSGSPGRTLFVNVSFYFALLYFFYCLNRAAAWILKRFFFRDRTEKKKRIFDSIVITFIIMSALAYFIILSSYRFILPLFS